MERILVMDDEPLVLSSIEKALAKVGYEVIAVRTKDSFKTAIRSGKFDLLITDVNLRDCTSCEIIDEAKDIVSKLKILTISGSVPAPDSRYFLQKPFRINELRNRVREILDESA